MELVFRIKQSPDIVFEHLTDMQKFASVHPVISRLERIAENNYLVHETLKLGILPFSFTYLATVESNRNELSVFMVATVFKLTTIEMRFVLLPEGDITQVEETINIMSRLPVKPVMRKVFKEQHEQLFKNIEALSR